MSVREDARRRATTISCDLERRITPTHEMAEDDYAWLVEAIMGAIEEAIDVASEEWQ